MTDNRIILRIDERVQFERQFSDAYKATPRSRRQEWLRRILRAGFESVQASEKHAQTAQIEPVQLASKPAQKKSTNLNTKGAQIA